jgi:tRNA U34 5-carboxymethylaminomethyl modifying GTPase MnmE/TrmE
VTSVPGTTRDAIEALLDRTPLPLRLVDTAGLRETDDPVEQLGIEMSQRYLHEAQVVLACGASEAELQHCVQVVEGRTTAAVLAVYTKCDLTQPTGEDRLAAMVCRRCSKPLMSRCSRRRPCRTRMRCSSRASGIVWHSHRPTRR